MRTARALTVSHSMLAGGVSAPGGVLLLGGVGVWSQGGCLLPGGGGLAALGGCEVPPLLTESQTPVKT